MYSTSRRSASRVTSAIVCAFQMAWSVTAPTSDRMIQGTNNCTPTRANILTTVKMSGLR